MKKINYNQDIKSNTTFSFTNQYPPHTAVSGKKKKKGNPRSKSIVKRNKTKKNKKHSSAKKGSIKTRKEILKSLGAGRLKKAKWVKRAWLYASCNQPTI